MTALQGLNFAVPPLYSDLDLGIFTIFFLFYGPLFLRISRLN